MSIVKRNNVLFPSIMNDFFAPDWFGGIDKVRATLPAVNIKEDEKGFHLELSIPGGKKEDFNIEVDNDTLTISNEVKTNTETKDEKYTRREFSYTAFKRAFVLPETVDGTKIDASYEAGILRLALPKKEEALPKPKRLIEIK